MDIILLENVEKLGFKNEIVKVKAGYGRNFLFISMLKNFSSVLNLLNKIEEKK